MKIEIGSGGSPKEGYIHCDVSSDYPHIEHVCKADKLPFNTDEIDEIFMTGVFEHFSYEESAIVLRECFRCLKNGGFIDINAPNFGWFIQCLNNKKIEPSVPSMIGKTWEEQRNWLLHGIYGWQRNPDDFHKWGWTEDTLKTRIEEVGFSQVVMYSENVYEGVHLCFKGYKK